MSISAFNMNLLLYVRNTTDRLCEDSEDFNNTELHSQLLSPNCCTPSLTDEHIPSHLKQHVQ